MTTEPTGVPVCPRHPDRESWVRCQRCERPACPECQRPAAVGVQCLDCVAEGNRGVRRPRTTFGGALRRRDTAVTTAIIGACVAVFLGRYVLPGSIAGYLPLVSAPGYTNTFGASTWWQPLTSAFLHAGLLHLLLNMYALYVTGQYLEPLLGRVRFLALYVLSALGGAAGALWLSTSPGSLVGASGAVFGLFAALFVVNRQLGRQTGQVLVLIGINLALGFFVAGVSWQAHLGGLVTGAVVAWILARGRRTLAAAQWAGLAVVASGIVALLAVAAARLAV